MPENTTARKIEVLNSLGAVCDLVPHGTDVSQHAFKRANTESACYLNQFGLAERATDWRGNNNIAESMMSQMAKEANPEPRWIVCGAGTGGTSATIGRYLKYRRLNTQLCVAEPEGGAFAQGWLNRNLVNSQPCQTVIEGIGRSQIEPGFMFDVVDEVIEVADDASCAGAWILEKELGRRYGGSSGTNLMACLQLAISMREQNETGSIISLLCDRGERYTSTLFNPQWLADHNIHIEQNLNKWLGIFNSADM
jgi:cysteine synthase A